MAIRIVLADDHQLVREGLRSLLLDMGGVEIVAETTDGHQTLAAAQQHEPDVILMDVAMSGLNGIEATQQVMSVCPNVRVIALSQHSDKRSVSAMLQAGAVGYVLKANAFDELRQAVLDVAAGQPFVSPSLTGMLIGNYVSRLDQAPESPASQLTPREREILQLLVEGKAAPEIADLLHVSANTVGSHRQHIMEKLDIHTLPELTKFAIREGITYLDS